MSRHNRFLSALLRSGCSCTRADNQIRSIRRDRIMKKLAYFVLSLMAR
jgi:hypothetical protein